MKSCEYRGEMLLDKQDFQKLFQKSIDKREKSDIIYKHVKNVPLAQLDRVFGYEPKGRGFESLMARQKRNIGTQCLYSFFSHSSRF